MLVVSKSKQKSDHYVDKVFRFYLICFSLQFDQFNARYTPVLDFFMLCVLLTIIIEIQLFKRNWCSLCCISLWKTVMFLNLLAYLRYTRWPVLNRYLQCTISKIICRLCDQYLSHFLVSFYGRSTFTVYSRVTFFLHQWILRAVQHVTGSLYKGKYIYMSGSLASSWFIILVQVR